MINNEELSTPPTHTIRASTITALLIGGTWVEIQERSFAFIEHMSLGVGGLGAQSTWPGFYATQVDHVVISGPVETIQAVRQGSPVIEVTVCTKCQHRALPGRTECQVHLDTGPRNPFSGFWHVGQQVEVRLTGNRGVIKELYLASHMAKVRFGNTTQYPVPSDDRIVSLLNLRSLGHQVPEQG